MKLRRGGIWSPISVTPGQSRVANLALMSEVATGNAPRAPGPITHQRRERGRGLITLFHDHPTLPLAWEEPGVGTLALTHSEIHPCKSQVCSPSACVHKRIFPIP